MKKNNLLSISLDTNILDTVYGNSQSRQLEYAKYFDTYCVIVFRKGKSKNYKQNKTSFVGTESKSKTLYILDAIKLAVNKHKQSPFDIITTQDPLATGIVGVILKTFFRIPLNIQLHTDYFSKNWQNQSLRNKMAIPVIKWQLRQANSIRVLTEFQKEEIHKKLGVSKNKIFIAPIRVNLEKFYNPVKTKKKLTKFITVSRLSPEKNVKLQIDVFARLVTHYPNLQLNIVGDGPQRLEVESKIERMGLSKHVAVLGYKSENKVVKLLKSSDVFLLTSNYEGFGLAIVEAGAAGLPIVATQTAGNKLIQHNKTGLLSQPDVQSLVQQITTILENSARANKIAKKMQKKVIENYQPEKLVRAWITGLYATK